MTHIYLPRSWQGTSFTVTGRTFMKKMVGKKLELFSCLLSRKKKKTILYLIRFYVSQTRFTSTPLSAFKADEFGWSQIQIQCFSSLWVIHLHEPRLVKIFLQFKSSSCSLVQFPGRSLLSHTYYKLFIPNFHFPKHFLPSTTFVKIEDNTILIELPFV